MKRQSCLEMKLHERIRKDPVVRRMYSMNRRAWPEANLVLVECRKCHSTVSYPEEQL